MAFQKSIKVRPDDLDDLKHVNNVRYVLWIQDISKEHWQAKAPQHVQEQSVWVVLKHIIDYKAAAILNDPILITTYIAKSKGAISVRIVEMRHERTQELLVRSSTEWCLLHRESHRPMRIPQEIMNIFL